MTPDEEARELRRAFLQTVAELNSGLELAGRQLRAGKFRDAADTLTTARGLVHMQDTLAQRFIKAHK